MRATTLKLHNLAYKLIPGPYLVVYAKSAYGYSWRDLIRTWRESSDQSRESFLGMPIDRGVDFFSRLADRQGEECTTYTCVYGCCWIEWHPKKGNLGGGGPAGCPCDGMDDPRDMSTGQGGESRGE